MNAEQMIIVFFIAMTAICVKNYENEIIFNIWLASLFAVSISAWRSK